MSRIFKTMIIAGLLGTAVSMGASAQGGFGLAPGMAMVYSGGQTGMMAVAAGETNHKAMMRRATKVPNDTVFFMSDGQLYMAHGRLDPTGNFYIN
ncbi:hypothetical protein [Bradyrhizobium sp. STM 3809]|uniref:hypothetical protein n=1 Tax=Bradyrhizobium sp. STM 3809 TaxID=551936 RepID=UPI0002405A3B|nr:hypothetical protein [Bradyrhizobium sp. STM 3809]CCD98092.1 conserved exported hypothetical protein [Bradyrhizobium sp. STM 3809]